MAAPSVTPHRKYLHSEACKEPTFSEISLAPRPTGADGPYLVRYQDAKDCTEGKAFSSAESSCAISLTVFAGVNAHRRQLKAPHLEMVLSLVSTSAEWEDLPALPFLSLAGIGPTKPRVRMHIYGTEMYVCKTDDGIKDLRGWKSDPAEIAFYESGHLNPALSCIATD